MTNLIHAHFARLRRAPVFWLAAAVSAGAGLFIQNAGLVIFPPACCAVVFSLFFGAEHADGAIRNKLIAGHGRMEIYLSALTVSVLVMWLFLALSSPRIILTARQNSYGHFTPGEAVLTIAAVMLSSAATAAVLTALCMLVHKRAVLAILLIFLVLGGVVAGSAALDELTAYDGGWQLEYDPVEPAEGQEPVFPAAEGPGLPRSVYEPPSKPPAALTAATNALPAAQIFQALRHSGRYHATWAMLVWSLAEIGLVTAAGLILFRRKDIR